MKDKINLIEDEHRNTSSELFKANRIAVAISALTVLSQFAISEEEKSDGGLEEMIVTAQQREQNLQEVPIAISAFDAGAIEAYMFNDVADYITRTPNASWASAGSRSRRELSIRGVTNSLT
jgi:iron complex outermembrane receptor protein